MNSENPGDARPAYDQATADRLSELGYIGLFQQADETALNAIGNAPGSAQSLEALLLASGAPMLARFLAAEILWYRDQDALLDRYRPLLAPLYAAALAQDFTQAANAWALPGVSDGLAGQHLLSIGEPMVPELLPLLDDDRRVYYEGSQEATLGHHYAYRIKDLAAYFLSKIANIPLALDADTSLRDEAIEGLKPQLAWLKGAAS